MPSLVRFYIAIEDGSAQVERDFGALTDGTAYKGGRGYLYDDLLVLYSCGPDICADDVCESAIGDVKTLGPLGQRCAARWRTMFGARLGICRKSKVGERRGLKECTYVACKADILVATGNAVLARRVERATPNMLTNFAFMQRAKQKWIVRRVGATVDPLQNVRSIGFVTKFGEASLFATEVGSDSAANGEPIEVRTCRMRCMNADLIVVENLACLYDCAEDEMLCHVLVVIGRGASVVTLPAWNLAARNPNKVAPTSVIRHQPLAIQKRVTFVSDKNSQTRYGAVIQLLEALVGLANSIWKL